MHIYVCVYICKGRWPQTSCLKHHFYMEWCIYIDFKTDKGNRVFYALDYFLSSTLGLGSQVIL